jgi:hypothetical protein
MRKEKGKKEDRTQNGKKNNMEKKTDRVLLGD